MKDPNRMHTQEKAFVLLAAQSMLSAGGPVSLTRDGAALDIETPAPHFNLSRDELDAGANFANAGEGPLFASVSVYGAPTTPPAAAAQGFTLTKRLATRAGRPVDPTAIRQNDRLVVIVAGKPSSNRFHPAVIADLLPAGFEIEAALGPQDGAQRDGATSGPYGWIGKISPTKVAEARDDRFVAAIDLYDNKSEFALAYIVRAVTPGEYVFPGAVIEDMYRPGVFARTATSKIKISAAQ